MLLEVNCYCCCSSVLHYSNFHELKKLILIEPMVLMSMDGSYFVKTASQILIYSHSTTA